MKHRSLIVLVALTVAFAAAACSSSSSSPSAAGSTLEGTWQWTASTEAVPASQSVVPDPENYTITFASDGTYTGKADCNQIAGTYTVDGSNLTIAPGPSTLAFCGEASLDAHLSGRAGQGRHLRHRRRPADYDLHRRRGDDDLHQGLTAGPHGPRSHQTAVGAAAPAADRFARQALMAVTMICSSRSRATASTAPVSASWRTASSRYQRACSRV